MRSKFVRSVPLALAAFVFGMGFALRAEPAMAQNCVPTIVTGLHFVAPPCPNLIQDGRKMGFYVKACPGTSGVTVNVTNVVSGAVTVVPLTPVSLTGAWGGTTCIPFGVYTATYMGISVTPFALISGSAVTTVTGCCQM